MRVVGRSVSKNDKTREKNAHFVGMQMRDDMAMTLGNVKQKEANSIEIKEVQSAARMTA